MSAPEIVLEEEHEACVPGGMTWDETVHIPMLADFECPRCGGIPCECPPAKEEP